jgi:formate/nitrite transporter FocA (FNT family)
VCGGTTHWQSVECMGLVACRSVRQRPVLVQFCFGGVGYGVGLVMVLKCNVESCTGEAMEGLVLSRSGNVWSRCVILCAGYVTLKNVMSRNGKV